MKPNSTSLTALAIRLSASARTSRFKDTAHGIDLRYAAMAVRQFASVLLAEEAARESDPVFRRQLEREAADLWCSR